MDPGTIINVVGLVMQLLQVVRDTLKDGSKRRKRYHDELHSFDEELNEYLQYIKEQAVPIGFKSKSLDVLHVELQNFVSSAKDLLSSNNCKKEIVQQLRENAKDMLQKRMGFILLEVCFESYEGIRVIKEMLAKNQEMVSKNNGVHINIYGNLMLTGVSPYVTKSPWEHFRREHLNLVVPTVEAGPFVHPFRIADVGMIKGVEESGSIKEDAAMYVPHEEEEKKNKKKKEGAGVDVKEKMKEAPLMERAPGQWGKLEEEKDKKKKEGAGMDVLEEKEKMKEAPLTERALGQWSILERQDNEGQDNPNRNMELIKMEGKGELLMSKLERGRIEMTYTWCEESLGMVIGNSPMEVSPKLGYCYFEVKLVEMAELLEGSETRLAGVGVGLTRRDKFRTSKMAGKYSKSCGYDGRVGEVYYENRVQEGPSRLNYLAMGDTLGIGLLQHLGQHHVFFAKNRELQVCFRVDSLCAPSRHGSVYPVISLASAHVRLHVNFQGPFEMSELLVRVKAYK